MKRIALGAVCLVVMFTASAYGQAEFYAGLEFLVAPGSGFSAIGQASLGAGLEDEQSRGTVGVTARRSLGAMGHLTAFQRLPGKSGVGAQARAYYNDSDIGFLDAVYNYYSGFRELRLTARVARPAVQLTFFGVYANPENVQWASLGYHYQLSAESSIFAALHVREHLDWTEESHLILFGPQLRVQHRYFSATVRMLTQNMDSWRPALSMGASIDL